MNAIDTEVLLGRVIANITTEAKSNRVPLWRVQTIVARVLMIYCKLIEENGGPEAWEIVEPKIRLLLQGTCADVDDVMEGL